MDYSNKIIIGLTGLAQSGKDTVGKYLIEKYGFKRIAFADKIRTDLYRLNPLVIVPSYRVDILWKQAKPESKLKYDYLHLPGGDRLVELASLVDAVGWDKAKQVSGVRVLLQRRGDDAGRQLFGENFWVEQGFAEIKEEDERVFFSDVRYDNEGQAIYDAGGINIRVTRPGLTRINDHPSENGIEDGLVHGYILNPLAADETPSEESYADLIADVELALEQFFGDRLTAKNFIPQVQETVTA